MTTALQRVHTKLRVPRSEADENFLMWLGSLSDAEFEELMADTAFSQDEGPIDEDDELGERSEQ